jgi:hypothetical protein
MEKIFKIHQFLKKHDPKVIQIEGAKMVRSGTISQCESCGMLFWHSHYPITSIAPSQFGDKTKALLDLIPAYSLETFMESGDYGKIWWAGKTGDSDSKVLDSIINKKWQHELLEYAHVAGKRDKLTETISTMGWESLLYDYCAAIKEPLPDFKDRIKSTYLRKNWYYNIEKPLFERKVKELEIKKSELWSQMKTAWKDTKLYNSDWYKQLENQHRMLVDEAKKVHSEKMNSKQWKSGK